MGFVALPNISLLPRSVASGLTSQRPRGRQQQRLSTSHVVMSEHYGLRRRPRASNSPERVESEMKTLSSSDVPHREQGVAEEGESKTPEVWKLVGIVALHIAVATVSLCVLEGFTLLDSVYFAVTVASTVGYGDIVVTRDASKLFVAAYALLSVALIGGIAAAVVDNVVNRQRAMAEKLRARLLVQSTTESTRELGGTTDARGEFGLVQTASIAAAEARGRLIASALLLVVVCVAGGSLYGYLQNLSLVDTIHLVTATLTTVGFGDLSPQTSIGKTFGIVWLLLSSLGLANMLGQWGELKLRRSEVEMTKQLMSSSMSEAVYDEIDADGDGRLDQVEYITYVLSKLGKTTPSEVRAICRRFEELDRDNSNYISRKELDLH
jgi:potassium channel subfamily K, other eukaryote